jgi:hypothetical protein
MAAPGQEQAFESLGTRVRELNRLDADPGASVPVSGALLQPARASLRAARLSSAPQATAPERRTT